MKTNFIREHIINRNMETIYEDIGENLKTDPEFIQVTKNIQELQDKLEEGCGKELMINLADNHCSEVTFHIDAAFELGFKYGSRMMAACCQD